MARHVTHEHYEEPAEMAAEMTQSQIIPQKFHHDESVSTENQHAGQPVLQDQMLVDNVLEHHDEHDPVQLPSQNVMSSLFLNMIYKGELCKD